MQQFLPIGKASDLLGVSVDTIRNWDIAGKINVYRTPGGERRIPLDEIERLTNPSYSNNTKARDSSSLLGSISQLEPNVERLPSINPPPSVISPQPIPKKPSLIKYTSKVFALTTTITLLLLFTANKLPGTYELIQKYTLGDIEVTSSLSSKVGSENAVIPAATTTGIGSITGTPGRITVLGADDLIVNIATTYGGQKSISTLGTITTGIWNGTVLTDTFVSDTLTIDGTGSVSAGAVNSGTLGTAGVTLGLGSFGSVTGSLADVNVSNT